MAEDERLTKRERREQARRERRAAEAEAAKRAQRNRIVGWVVAVLVAAGVGAIVWVAVQGGADSIGDEIVLQPDAVAAAQETAGCEILDAPLMQSADHVPAGQAPPASAMYTSVRPTHSGPHFESPHPVGTFDEADERATTHNLEHGAIVAWWSTQQVDGDTVGRIESWAESLNASGFEQSVGPGVITSGFEEVFTSGKAIALRAWGIAMDCDDFDEAAANGFVAAFYGTNGRAPERSLAPYPQGVLRFELPATPDASPDGGSPQPDDDTPEETPDASPS